MFSRKNKKTTKELKDIKIFLSTGIMTNTDLLKLKLETYKSQGNRGMEKKYQKAHDRVKEGALMSDVLYEDLKLIDLQEYENIKNVKTFTEGLEFILGRRTDNEGMEMTILYNLFVKPFGILMLYVMTFDLVKNENTKMNDMVIMLKGHAFSVEDPLMYGTFDNMTIFLYIYFGSYILFFLYKFITARFFPVLYIQTFKTDALRKLRVFFGTISSFEKAGINISQTAQMVQKETKNKVDKRLWSHFYYYYMNEENNAGINKDTKVSDILISNGYDKEVGLLMETASLQKGHFYEYVEIAQTILKEKYERRIEGIKTFAVIYSTMMLFIFLMTPMLIEMYYTSISIPMALQ